MGKTRLTLHMYNKDTMLANPDFPLKPLKWYRKLSTRKGRLESGAFLVEGEKAIRQITQSSPESIIEILATEADSSIFTNYHNRTLTEKQFQSVTSAETPQGLMAVVCLPVDTYSETLPDKSSGSILLLENIQDPGNIGTLIRTAAAFDFDGVILTDRCADAFSPKCVQASAGTVLSLWIRRSTAYLELAQKLKQKGLTITVADIHGSDDPSRLSSQNKLVIALGNEATGPSQALLRIADYQLKIPVAREKAESLNVAACGAICMYLSSLKG